MRGMGTTSLASCLFSVGSTPCVPQNTRAPDGTAPSSSGTGQHTSTRRGSHTSDTTPPSVLKAQPTRGSAYRHCTQKQSETRPHRLPITRDTRVHHDHRLSQKARPPRAPTPPAAGRPPPGSPEAARCLQYARSPRRSPISTYPDVGLAVPIAGGSRPRRRDRVLGRVLAELLEDVRARHPRLRRRKRNKWTERKQGGKQARPTIIQCEKMQGTSTSHPTSCTNMSAQPVATQDARTPNVRGRASKPQHRFHSPSQSASRLSSPPASSALSATTRGDAVRLTSSPAAQNAPPPHGTRRAGATTNTLRQSPSPQTTPPRRRRRLAPATPPTLPTLSSPPPKNAPTRPRQPCAAPSDG